jgi:hypothetical protein
MNARTFLRAALFFLLSPLPLLAVPAKNPSKAPTVRTSGMFSNLELSRETGDVGGWGMFFFQADKAYVLVLQGEGELRKPSLCEVLTEGNAVRFARKTSDTLLEFRGAFSATHLTGKFTDGTALKIPRKNDLLLTTFSDLAFSKETGDAMGMEIISFLADQPYVLVLQGAGDLLPPVLVAAKDEGKKLRFSFKGTDGSLTSFNGTYSKTFLSGILSSTGEPDRPLKLPAKKSFWQ